MKKFWKRLPRWGKVLFWILAGIVGLILLFVIGFKIWTLTWKTYTNDEFGFSFRYPRSWYIGGTDITQKQLNEKNVVYFWIDSKQTGYAEGDSVLDRSSGSVVVELEKNTMFTVVDTRKQQGVLQNYKKSQFGNEEGYSLISAGLVNAVNGKTYMFSKELLVVTNSYTFNADTLTYADNIGFLAKLRARIYFKIGSDILGSFLFTK